MEIEPCLHGGRRPPSRTAAGPDGWEAWIVALAAFFINFVMAGVGRTSGILYVALIDIFHTDRKQASLPFTVRSSMRNLLGPVVGILGEKYGVRPVIIAGGIIGTITSAACFAIDDIGWMTVVWGGINGVGTALITTLPQVVIGQHFEKKRSTASGLAFSGGCFSSLIFPTLIEYLLYNYDLGGTFLMIAGFIMHVIPAALILKPPSWWNRRKASRNWKSNDLVLNGHEKEGSTVASGDEVTSKTEDGVPSSVPLLCERDNSTTCDVDSEFLWENRLTLIGLLTCNSTLPYEQSGGARKACYHTDDMFVKKIELLLRHSQTNGTVDSIDTCFITPPVTPEPRKKSNRSETVVYLDNRGIESPTPNGQNVAIQSQTLNSQTDAISIDYLVYYMDKLLQREKEDICRHFLDLEQRGIVEKILETLGEFQDILRRQPSVTSVERSNSFCSHIRTALGLYKQPMFILICLCRCVHFMTFVPAITTVVDFTMDKGLSPEYGKYSIAALSFGDLVGRLGLGWITDSGYISMPRYMLIVMVAQGVSTVVLPFMHSFWFLLTSLGAFGLLQGSAFVRHPVLVARYMGEHEQSIAMGCIDLFSGFIGLLLPLYIGYFRDVVGSYDGIYYLNGCASTAIGLGWHFEPFLRSLQTKRANGERYFGRTRTKSANSEV